MEFLKNPFSRLKEYLFLKGWIRKDVTLYQAIAMMVGTTIGAGVLGVPYAVSKVGLLFGIILIVLLGFLVIGLNLLVGEVSARTNGSFQLVGLAKKYLGPKGGALMTFIFYIQLFVILTVYIIGMGGIASEFFWGGPLLWGIVVWFLGSLVVFKGMHAIKTVEFILTGIILVTILTISFLAMPHVQGEFVKYSNWTAFLVPYGVVLFALSGVGTIPAAYRLLHGQNEDFKHAIIASTSIAMVIYIVFTFLVVGVLGNGTTEIATLGLGQALGRPMFYAANAFAILAMMTSFIMLGMQLRDSMEWDFQFPYLRASAIALLVPLAIFLLGLRQFIFAINIVGGVFYSIQMFLLVLVYWKAKQSGEMDPVKYNLHHAVLISAFTLIAFSIGAAYSLYGMFW
jgi:tyrosine-specific transport protein